MMEVEGHQSNNNSETDESFNGSSSENRLNQIISDYCRVQESASNEIDRKRRTVRSKCEERIWMAALWRDYQLEIVKKSFDSEIKQIEREHQSEFNNLKDSLMQELQEERKKLLILEQVSSSNLSIDKTGNLITFAPTVLSDNNNINDAMTAALIAAEEQAAVASGRRLRRRDDRSEQVSGVPSVSITNPSGNLIISSGTNGITGFTSSAALTTNSSASRRKQVNNIYTYNTLLPEQEILDDLGAIAKEAGSLGTSRRAAAVIKNSVNSSTNNTNPSSLTTTSNVNVSYDKGMLHYNWDIIGVSDRIKIQLSPNTSAVHATVLACSSTDLIISTGRNQIKISISDLKTGKVIIFTEDQSLHDN